MDDFVASRLCYSQDHSVTAHPPLQSDLDPYLLFAPGMHARASLDPYSQRRATAGALAAHLLESASQPVRLCRSLTEALLPLLILATRLCARPRARAREGQEWGREGMASILCLTNFGH
eukprot:4905083-Pleurochrysis_carterae.AAC.1